MTNDQKRYYLTKQYSNQFEVINSFKKQKEKAEFLKTSNTLGIVYGKIVPELNLRKFVL